MENIKNLKFLSNEEQAVHIIKQLNDKELELFLQKNRKNIESLDNHFADWGNSTYVEREAYESLKSTFSKQIVEKVESLYKTHIYSGSTSEPVGMIHMDKFECLLKTIIQSKTL